ncbi:MAG TPA: 50S ribosomal protein L24 [Anaerolineales bacterium]|uniref:Large ribosomal subunit protein uL24 n=1 Tax=uncultured Chloroflexi bacterium Rifle_16ft_4_minimus_14836 TaxID=1665059 RepID=A0A0H4TKW1_9CHLR|nr:50S ribosomal protein L24, large subunit ribosomal protein L24 [uncultured Chloroflexi bacterium Rifle_16ft_4_minimus_14836]HLC34695.1 50S ribosomal protein L24 [Anaerolineales bacterium]HLF08972.1 50S ribosomal protein L24 [Dehalococcoidia bacterium]
MQRVRKDDTVLVITGRNRGKTGKVLRVLPREDRVVIEGVNIIKRHTKARGMVRQAGIVEREAPIHLSNVMVVCPKCHKAARVGFGVGEEGKARVCRQCGEAMTS